MTRSSINKLSAAERQIRTAVVLFFNGGDLLSVMTLAGAAEEICGNLLRRSGKKNIIGVMYDEAVRQGLALTRADVYNRASRLRNALKHATAPEEDTFVFDDEAAVLMLVRAVINFQLTGAKLPGDIEHFIQWVQKSGLVTREET